MLAQAEGDPRRAERELRAAIEQEPLSFDALARLLDLQVAQRRAKQVLPQVERAAARAPASPRHLALLGTARLAAGDQSSRWLRSYATK